MTQKQYDQIDRGVSDLSDGETSVHDHALQYCEAQGWTSEVADEWYRRWFRAEAIAAGVPASVVDGRTRLTDHFSPEYIRWMCGQPPLDTED